MDDKKGLELKVTNIDGETLWMFVHRDSDLDDMFGHFRTILTWLTYECGKIGEIEEE